MTNLSEALKKFYERSGNKVIFKNNYTLNQLSLEIWTKLGYKNFDSSTLSRVINGDRLFTQDQLNAFCLILNIGGDKKKNLLNSLEEDYIFRLGLKIPLSKITMTDIIDLLTVQYKYLRLSREKGHLDFANNWSHHIADIIELYAKKENNQVYKKELLSLLGNVTYEKGYISCSTHTSRELKYRGRPITDKLFNLAKQIRSTELMIKARTVLGFYYYALGNYSKKYIFKDFYLKSIDEAKKSLSLLKDEASDEFTLISWRYVAMNSIYIDDMSLFQCAEKQILRIVEKNLDDQNFSFIVWALDTIARGKSHFRDKTALTIIKKSQDFNQKIPWDDELRQASMIRNEIDVLNNLKVKDPNYISKLASEGLMLSKKLGIFRYENLFERYL